MSNPTFDDNPARGVIPLDNGIARPWDHDEGWQNPAVAHWQSLLDRRLIGNPAPCAPAVAAQREASDALFRGFARDRHRAARLAARL